MLFLFASPEIELAENIILAAECLVIIYLWAQKGIWPFNLLRKQIQAQQLDVPLKEDEEEHELDQIVDAKLNEIAELQARKESVQEIIRQAKRKYMKGEIAVDTYRGAIHDAEKELLEIDARLNLLREFGEESQR